MTTTVTTAEAIRTALVPRQAFLPIWRQLFLPVHLLIPTLLLGGDGPVAGDAAAQVSDEPEDS